MELSLILAMGAGLFTVIAIAKTAIIVPQRSAYVIERLGKYAKTLEAGFHILVPLLDRVAYRHSLKEETIDVAEQTCITKDNIEVTIDGVLYLQVVDAKDASYGIENYRYAATQLAQTTLRSAIGKIDLDKTFNVSVGEKQEAINLSEAEKIRQIDVAACGGAVREGVRQPRQSDQHADSAGGALEPRRSGSKHQYGTVGTASGRNAGAELIRRVLRVSGLLGDPRRRAGDRRGLHVELRARLLRRSRPHRLGARGRGDGRSAGRAARLVLAAVRCVTGDTAPDAVALVQGQRAARQRPRG